MITDSKSYIKLPFTGVGNYTYNMVCRDEAHLSINHIDSEGSLTKLLTTQYSVILGIGGIGGTVAVSDSNLSSGFLFIKRDVPLAQTINLTNSSRLDMELLERGLDTTVMLIQQIRDYVSTSTVDVPWRGEWSGPGVSYTIRDLAVAPDGDWYISQETHISSGSFSADLAAGNWLVWIPMSSYADVTERIQELREILGYDETNETFGIDITGNAATATNATTANTLIESPDLYGNVGIGRTASTSYSLDTSGNIRVANTEISSDAVEINSTGTGNRNAVIDGHACDTWEDYSYRLVRYAGVNGQLDLIQRGAGMLKILTQDGADIQFAVGTDFKVVVDSIGLSILKQSAGTEEGGQLTLGKSDITILSGDTIIDVRSGVVRLFEDGGTSRGAYLDLTRCAAGVGSEIALVDDISEAVSSNPMHGLYINATSGNTLYGRVDCISLKNPSTGKYKLFNDKGFTLDTAVVGAGGLDSGTLADSYGKLLTLWAIGKEDGTFGVIASRTYYDASVVRVSGTPVLSSLTDVTSYSLQEGDEVWGPHIPFDAKIVSVDASTQITISKNAQLSTSSYGVVVYRRPTLPSGYVYMKRIGTFYADSVYGVRTFIQQDNRVYLSALDSTPPPLLGSGIIGTFSTTTAAHTMPTYIVSGSVVPNSAKILDIRLSRGNGAANVALSGGQYSVSGIADVTTYLYPDLVLYNGQGMQVSGLVPLAMPATVYMCSSGATGIAHCIGWVDSI